MVTGRGSPGYTLLELALALVVIGLLMGLAIPAWQSMQRTQRLAATRAHLEAVGRCLEEYVLHSERIPPQAYFVANCRRNDAWGEPILYQSSGDGQEVAHVGTKTLQDNNGTYPDVVWVIVSTGPDRTGQLVTTPTTWNCAGDDLCIFATRNDLICQISR